MTDNVQDALPVVEQEVAGKPTPQLSGGSAEAGSVAAGPDTSALAKELAEVKERLSKLPDEIDARFKSAKDKRFSKVDEIYAWVKAAGGDPSKIEDKVERQELLERLDALEKPGSVQGGAPGRAAAEDIESKTVDFLNDLKDESGVEMSDEELKEIWAGKRYLNLNDAFKDVKKAAWKKAKQAGVGPEASAGSPGRHTGAAETDDEIADQLEAAMKEPTKKAGELKRLREEAKKRGLLK